MTGLRAFMLAIPCLAVFIVRVMNMEVGRRNTTSGFETFVQKVTSGRSWMTVAWYVFSGWFYGEVYIWSKGREANLGWIDSGRSYERPRANENPVLLRCFWVTMSVAQAVWHLYGERDSLIIGEKEEVAQRQAGGSERVPEPVRQLYAQAGSIVGRVIPFTICGVILSFPVYEIFLRKPAWNYMAYPLARALVRQLPANAGPGGLIHPMTLAWQAVTSSAMLILLWELSNAVFTIYVSQLPLKKGQPLTSEIKDASGQTILSKSKDPNGSLIRGFKAKNTTPRSFAFWELYLVCTRFETRRKTIFTEVDRKPESTWTQISSLCLAEITAISTRIKLANEPTEYEKKAAQTEQQRQQQEGLIAQQRAQSLGLPKIANQKVYDNADVFAKRQPTLGQTVGKVAKAFGQSPGAPNPVTPRARKAIKWTEERTGGKDVWSLEGVSKGANGYAKTFLRSPLGEYFRQTFSRRVCAVVFGVPFSSKVNIIHAAKSLTRLAVSSLKEDDFGQAAKDIPVIIRAFTTTVADIEKFMKDLEPSWTDVQFNDSHRDVKEVFEVVDVLKAGLEEIVLAFGEYATALGLSAKEMREAKEAVGRRDMRQREV